MAYEPTAEQGAILVHVINRNARVLAGPQGRARPVRVPYSAVPNDVFWCSHAYGTGSSQPDVLVLACGVDTPRVEAMAEVNVPLKGSPGVLAHTLHNRA